jgi:predicted TPR repeat methyltransferase
LRKFQHSSGDLAADRRASYAEVLASEQEFAEAAEVMVQALELAPDWAAGWNSLGRYLEEAGKLDAAREAWQRSVALDPEGRYGAGLKLAAHGEAMPANAAAYVETLFDDYAPRFETSLVARLGYGVPGELAAMMSRFVPGRAGTALDLGCGTGLMGVQLRGMAVRLEGVDLSAAMLAEARWKQVYDALHKADLVAFLADWEGQAELATATDVLNYTGALPPVLAAVRRKLAPGGLFGFSLETHEGPEAHVLRSSLRYQHQPERAIDACVTAGFEVLARQETVIRMDRGQPVAGVLMLVRAG